MHDHALIFRIQFGDAFGVGVCQFVQEVVGSVEEHVRELVGERLVLQ